MKKKIVTGILCLCSLTLFAQEGQTYTIPATQGGSGMRTTKTTFTPQNGANGIQTIRITVTPPKKVGGSGSVPAWKVEQQKNDARLNDHDRQLENLREHDKQTDAQIARLNEEVFSKKDQGSPRLQYSNSGYNDGSGQYDNTDNYRRQYNQNDHDEYNRRVRQYDNEYSQRGYRHRSRFDPDWIRVRNGRIAIGISITALVLTGVGLAIYHDHMMDRKNAASVAPISPTPTPTPSPVQPTSGTGGPGGNTTIP